MRRAHCATLAIVLGSLLLAACGGGGSPSTTGTAGTAPGSTAGGSATTAAGAATTAVAKSSGGSGNDFCGLGTGIGAAMAAQAGGTTGKTDLKGSITSLQTALDTLAGTAPAAIKADFETVRRALAPYLAALAKNNYDLTKIMTDPDLQASMDALSDPKFETASTNIDNWVQANCTTR